MLTKTMFTYQYLLIWRFEEKISSLTCNKKREKQFYNTIYNNMFNRSACITPMADQKARPLHSDLIHHSH